MHVGMQHRTALFMQRCRKLLSVDWKVGAGSKHTLVDIVDSEQLRESAKSLQEFVEQAIHICTL